MIRIVYHLAALTMLGTVLAGCSERSEKPNTEAKGEKEDDMAEIPKEDLPKTESEWKEKLSAEEFRIARQKGTERAFSGKYWNEKSDGVYRCVCCKAPLFRSEHKFDSGTGWPSFYQEAEKNRVKENTDHTHGMTRTEVVCAKCEAHLGHVFEDGPKPTGMRYCINSASLVLDKKQDDSKKKE